jgi:hypothetical protein
MADAGAVTHAAAGTVKLPGFGNVSKKTLGIVALVAGGVLAYLYVRKARGGSGLGASTTAAGTAAATDPNLDPATGYDYGTPQDLAALQAQSGMVGGDPYGLGGGIGLGGGSQGGLYFDPATGQWDLTSPYTGTSTTTAAVTTNAEWEQECIANLEAGGVSQSTIGDAESGLPRYLAHLTLSGGQATAVQLAVGLTGPPPSGGPFSIRRAPAPPPKPKPAMVKVPSVTGLSYAAAAARMTAAGLKTRRGQPDVGIVARSAPAAGTEVAKGSTVILFGGLGVTPPNPPRP